MTDTSHALRVTLEVEVPDGVYFPVRSIVQQADEDLSRDSTSEIMRNLLRYLSYSLTGVGVHLVGSVCTKSQETNITERNQ